MRHNQPLQQPTFAQTVSIIRTMPPTTWTDTEALIDQHLALGFHYDKDQIHRAVKALTDPARPWSHSNRRSARST